MKSRETIIAISKWVFFFIFIYVFFVGQTLDDEVANLENRLKSLTGKEKVKTLLDLSKKYSKISLQMSIQYSSEALELARKNNWQSLIAKSLNVIGVLKLVDRELDDALEFFFQSLRISQDLKNDEDIARSLGHIAIVHSNLGNFDKALKNYLDSLQLYQKLDDQIAIADTLNNMGALYFKRKGDVTKALNYYLKSLKLKEKFGKEKDMIHTYINIGRVYSSSKEYKEALSYFKKSLSIAEKISNKDGIICSLNHLGNGYTKIKDFKTAEQNLLQGLELSLEIKERRYLEDIYTNLSELFIAKGDYKKAYDYLNSYVKVNGAILNEKTTQRIAEMQVKYDTLKKEKENEELKRKNEIQKIQFERERFARNAFIIGFILVVIILLLLFKKYIYLFAFWKKQKYISQYRLGEKIGSGGIGTVFSASSIRDKDKTVAIKILRGDLVSDEIICKRFKQEAAIINKLNHPNIIKIIEMGEYRDQLYIAMEFLKGRTLGQRIEVGKIHLPVCIHIMDQMIDALKFIHRRNILHRDLKPSNVMLIEKEGDPNFVKLLDFGLAKHQFQTTLTKEGELIGTLGYTSPEQLTDKEITFASDIYSLGIMYHELLTGIKVFSADEGVNIISQILNKIPAEPIKVRSEIPGTLNQLICAMIAKNPQNRPDTEEVYRILKKLAEKG